MNVDEEKLQTPRKTFRAFREDRNSASQRRARETERESERASETETERQRQSDRETERDEGTSKCRKGQGGEGGLVRERRKWLTETGETGETGETEEEGDHSPISRGSVTRGEAGLFPPQGFFCGGPAGRPPIHHHSSIQKPASVGCPGHTPQL